MGTSKQPGGDDDRLAGERPAITDYPVKLRPYYDAIEATRKSILEGKILGGEPDRPDGSQLGGRPWWPEGRPLPLGFDRKPMPLLIQVNLGDSPPLEGFPDRGLLQFFIGTDGLYGQRYKRHKRLPSSSACVWHETTDGPALSDFPQIYHDVCFGDSPLLNPTDPVRVAFSASTMVIDPEDFRFCDQLPEIADNDELREEFKDEHWTFGGGGLIYLVGYATYAQFDTRSSGSPYETSLLTLDSDEEYVMWGDVGVGQFFIRPRDLAARDFSRVIYNWDSC